MSCHGHLREALATEKHRCDLTDEPCPYPDCNPDCREKTLEILNYDKWQAGEIEE